MARARRKVSARRSDGGRSLLKRWEFRPGVETLEDRVVPAGVFTVTTLADDGSAGSLRGAVNQADKFIGAAQIVFAVNGVFKLTQFNDPATGPSDKTGDINITNNITFVGNGVQQTIVDANHLDRAFWISGPLTVNFNDLTIRNGSAGPNSTGATAAATGSSGGAIYAATTGATLNFTNVSITGNTSELAGGAIGAVSAAINVTNGYISDNQSGSSGGAIYEATGAAVTIVNSHLELNSAGDSGGAIYIGTNTGTQPTLTVTGSLLNNNHAFDDGGAIYDGSLTGGGVSLFNTSLINNNANSSGGAIYDTGDLSIDGNGGAPLAINGQNNIGFNNANDEGGAIHQTGGTQPANLFIANTNLSANRSNSSGGAVYTSAKTATLTNVLMVINVASDSGGAVYDTAGTTNKLSIVNSILNNNTAGDEGGAVRSDTNTFISGSRFDFNQSADSSGGAVYNSGATTFSMTNSNLDDNTCHESGGAVYTSATTATFTSDFIVGNVARFDEGGGIDADGTVLNITDSQIIGNTASDSSGGGVNSSSTTVNVTNCIITSNVAMASDGGGLYLDGAGTVTVLDSIIHANHATHTGGGLWTDADKLTVTNTTVTNNTCGSSGAGLYSDGVTMTLVSDLISGNQAGESGGGVYASVTTLSVNATTISQNYAHDNGGGVWTNATEVDFLAPGLGSLISANSAGSNGGGVYRSFSGTTADKGAFFTNVTFAANTAGSKGGAIFSTYGNTTAAGSAKLVLMNDTINLNAAGKGSAIYAANASTNAGSASKVMIDNTIIAGAPPGSGPNLGSTGAGVTFASASPGSNLTDNPNDLVVNGGKLSGFAANNVGLGPLQDNGGPTFTFALLPGSPAIDAATADQNPATGVPNADQRGVPRPQPVPGGTVDIGAFEAVPGDFLIAAAPAPGNAGGVNINVYQAVPTNAGPPPLVGTVSASDFTGGVHIALADVNDDGVPDLIVGSGAGQAPLVEVFSLNKNNGTFGKQIGSKVVPYSTAFTGGVYVAGGEFSNDKHADIVVGPGTGGGPEVKVFTLYQPGSDTLLGTPVPIRIRGVGTDGGFNAFPPSFTGGVTVAVSDVNGDGQDDIVAGQASNGGSFTVFDGRDVRAPLFSAQAFGSAFTGGINVAGGNYGRIVGVNTLGTVNGDVVVGQASGGGSIKVFDGDTHTQVGNSINPFGSGYTGGVSVSSVQDINGNQISEIVVGQTSGQGQIKVIDGSTFAFLDTFFANTAFTNGVFVGGGF